MKFLSILLIIATYSIASATACAFDSDCTTSQFCSSGGYCTTRYGYGVSCTSDRQCAGYCTSNSALNGCTAGFCCTAAVSYNSVCVGTHRNECSNGYCSYWDSGSTAPYYCKSYRFSGSSCTYDQTCSTNYCLGTCMYSNNLFDDLGSTATGLATAIIIAIVGSIIGAIVLISICVWCACRRSYSSQTTIVGAVAYPQTYPPTGGYGASASTQPVYPQYNNGYTQQLA